MTYKLDGIELDIEFIDDEDGAILVHYYNWSDVTTTTKEAIIEMMREAFDLEYFTDYTINATSIPGRREFQNAGTVLIWLRNPEHFVMIKLTAT